jgi:hypothetical protein
MARQWHPRFIQHRDGPMWVVLPLDKHWDSYVRFDAVEGHPVIAELRILPTLMERPHDVWIMPTLDPGDQPPQSDWLPPPPEGGLTARALRRAHLGRARELAYEQLGKSFQVAERYGGRVLPSKFTREAVRAPRRPGSKGRDDRFYATVAALYIEAIERGSNKPVVEAAQTLSKRRSGAYEPAYVRDLLHVARQRGLLTRPPRGRAGGQLTDKGRTALAETPKEES